MSALVLWSTSSVPKNCRPSLGGRLGFVPSGMPRKRSAGPNVGSTARPERARVQRARDELPERVEVGEARPLRVVLVGRGVVDVAGDPHDVADALDAQEAQQLGDLQLAAERRAGVAVRDRLEVRGAVPTTRPSGMSLATTFQAAPERARPCFSQSSCARPSSAVSGPARGWVLGSSPRARCACRSRRRRAGPVRDPPVHALEVVAVQRIGLCSRKARFARAARSATLFSA